MKYNKSNIMIRAWELVKKAAMTMSAALKQAWAEAKSIIKFENNMTVYADGYERELVRWTKYGNDRIYINGGSRKGDGYVDLKTGRAVLNGKLTYQVKIAEMILNMDFGA